MLLRPGDPGDVAGGRKAGGDIPTHGVIASSWPGDVGDEAHGFGQAPFGEGEGLDDGAEVEVEGGGVAVDGWAEGRGGKVRVLAHGNGP